MTTLAIILLSVGVLWFSRAYYASREQHRVQLDRIGRAYGVKRWPQEGNDQYADRIRTRIVIGNGVTWRN